ncbi:hypothetical protein AB0C61_24095 [Streptomyces sp. NPDC048680]|uniref:hypothetical protein n=1 Tax=Streptomyces sp. NPDC048680 TaxID=3155492 RepID=UPI0034361FC8
MLTCDRLAGPERRYLASGAVHTSSAPGAMAALRNLAIGRLRILGADNIAKVTRTIRDAPECAVWIWGVTGSRLRPGT